MGKKGNIILAVIISLLILIASSSYWYTKHILNTTAFTTTLSAALLSEESKLAIADEIVDTALKRRPLIKEFLGDTGKSAVYSLLGSKYFQSAFDTIATNVHTRMFTTQNEDFSINIVTLKQIVMPVIERLRPDLSQNLNPNQIPDKIIIIHQDDIPQVSKYTPWILWGGWISFMAVLILTIYYFYKSVAIDISLRTLGISMTALFLLAIISVITMLPLLTAHIVDPNLHIIAENVTQAFSTSYIKLLSLWALAGVVIIIVGYLYPYVAKNVVSARESLNNGKKQNK